MRQRSSVLMSHTPRLLMITPTMPAATGNGLAMRAGLFLDALSSRCEVTLLVIPVAGSASEDDIPGFVAERAAQILVQPVHESKDRLFELLSHVSDPQQRAVARKLYPEPALCRFATDDLVAGAFARLEDVQFDVVHVMRLYLAPYARPFLDQDADDSTACVLDLDDDEIETRMRLGDLYAGNGDHPNAMIEHDEAGKYRKLADQYLPKFSLTLVTSGLDQDRVALRHPSVHTEIIPNAVSLPQHTPGRYPGADFRILMVGTMGYYPNEDGALFFCREVLPTLREKTARDIHVDIVGRGPSQVLQQLNALPGVTVTGGVKHLWEYYARAHVAIIPLRAGGGTRIKLLEAFSHLTPVVSTSIGAEGIEVVNGKHLLLADDTDGLVDACLRVMHNGDLGRFLASNAYNLLTERYSSDVVSAHIQGLYTQFPWN